MYLYVCMYVCIYIYGYVRISKDQSTPKQPNLNLIIPYIHIIYEYKEICICNYMHVTVLAYSALEHYTDVT